MIGALLNQGILPKVLGGKGFALYSNNIVPSISWLGFRIPFRAISFDYINPRYGVIFAFQPWKST